MDRIPKELCKTPHRVSGKSGRMCVFTTARERAAAGSTCATYHRSAARIPAVAGSVAPRSPRVADGAQQPRRACRRPGASTSPPCWETTVNWSQPRPGERSRRLHAVNQSTLWRAFVQDLGVTPPGTHRRSWSRPEQEWRACRRPRNRQLRPAAVRLGSSICPAASNRSNVRPGGPRRSPAEGADEEP